MSCRSASSRRIPFAGRVFLLMTLGVGVAAVNTGNNLLYLALSLNLSLILLSGVLSEGTLRHITLRVRPASEAFAEAAAGVKGLGHPFFYGNYMRGFGVSRLLLHDVDGAEMALQEALESFNQFTIPALGIEVLTSLKPKLMIPS